VYQKSGYAVMARPAKKPSTDSSRNAPAKRAPKAKPTRTKANPLAIPVLGLGAPAGGMQAFTDFFEAMPDATGMAFVAICHVDPDHESPMSDLLAKHADMTVATGRG
jgi:two-component system CheB/CheR fusion protein